MTLPSNIDDGRTPAGSLAVTAAAAGILAGLTSCQTYPSRPSEPVTVQLPPPVQPDPGTLRVARADPPRPVPGRVVGRGESCCAGRNECKGQGNCKVRGMHDCKGKNECKAKGGCRASDCTTEERAKMCCAGKNECKGLGGCKTQSTSCKGMNNCKGLGGCATPCRR